MRGALRSGTWVIIATLLTAGGAFGWVQPKKKPAGGSSQGNVKKSMNATTKGVKHSKEVHDALAAFTGNFDTVTEISFAPGAEPMKTHDETTAKWVMGELFVQFNSMTAPDEEMKGDRMTIYGYDAGAKKYTMWQIETGRATAVTATGDYDAASKTFTFEGTSGNSPVVTEIHVEADGTLKKSLKMKKGSSEMREVAKVTHTKK